MRAYFFVEAAVRQQKRRPRFVVAEITAGAFHRFFVLSIAVNYPFDTLSGDAFGVVHHFYQNEFSISAIGFVHVEYSVGGSAGTGKGVENNIII